MLSASLQELGNTYLPDIQYILELVSPDPWVIELEAQDSRISGQDSDSLLLHRTQ